MNLRRVFAGFLSEIREQEKAVEDKLTALPSGNRTGCQGEW